MALLAAAAFAHGCGGSAKVASGPPIAAANLDGVSGCSTPAPAFGPGVVAFDGAQLAPHAPSSTSALAASASSPRAYLAIPGGDTGPAILQLDLDSGFATEIVGPEAFAAFDPNVSALSGLAVIGPATPDTDTLVVVDASTNRLLAASSVGVAALAGLSSPLGGFADGPVAGAMFDFSAPTQIAVGGDGAVYVPDPGNHRVRRVASGFVSTLAGSGAPGFEDGPGDTARFDGPDGVTIDCDGSLLVSESTNRVRRIRAKVKTGSPFAGVSVIHVVSTLAGDGTPATTDGSAPGTSQTWAPAAVNVARASSASGVVFWLDRGSGRLRRVVPGSGFADSVFAAPSVAPLGAFGMTSTFDGSVLLVDAPHGTILRIP